MEGLKNAFNFVEHSSELNRQLIYNNHSMNLPVLWEIKLVKLSCPTFELSAIRELSPTMETENVLHYKRCNEQGSEACSVPAA